MRLHLPDDWTSDFDTLERALTKPNRRFVVGLLTPVVSVNEIISWSSFGAGRRIDRGRRDWDAILRDFKDSADLIGPQVRQATDGVRRRLMAQLARPKDYSSIRYAADNYLEALSSSRTCEAAWLDLVELATVSGRYNEYLYRREVFLDIAGANQFELGSFGTNSVVIDVLADTLHAVAHAQRLTRSDVSVAFDPDSSHPLDRAGVHRDERLDLARKIWATGAECAYNVIWFIYDRAWLDSHRTVHIGPVSFTRCDRFFFDLTNRFYDTLPAEAEANRDEILSWFPAEPHDELTLVRVDLGSSMIGSAATRAQEMVDVVLDSLGRSVAPTWRQTGNLMRFVDGYAALVTHGPRSDRDEWDRAVMRDPVGEAIVDRGPEISNFTVSSDIRRSLALFRSMLGANLTPGDKVVTAAQALDHARSAARVNDNDWPAFAARVFRAEWVTATASGELMQSFFDVDTAARRRQGTEYDDASRERIRVLTEEARSVSESPARFEAVCERAIEMLRLADPTWLPARRLRDAATALSPSNADRLTRRLTRRFDVQLRRMVRIRNSLTHGGGTYDGSIGTIVGFSEWLSTEALSTLMDAQLRGGDVREAFESDRHKADARLVLLEAGQFSRAYSSEDLNGL